MSKFFIRVVCKFYASFDFSTTQWIDFVVFGWIHIWLDQGELFKMMIKKQYWNIGCPFFGEDCREIEVFDKRR